eukprot:704897-Prymnesium_polylepis.1
MEPIAQRVFPVRERASLSADTSHVVNAAARNANSADAVLLAPMAKRARVAAATPAVDSMPASPNAAGGGTPATPLSQNNSTSSRTCKTKFKAIGKND